MPENTPNWDLPPERFMTQEEIGKVLLKAHELFDLGVANNRLHPACPWKRGPCVGQQLACKRLA